VNTLISVIIPTYNHAHFLKEALKSVLDQSYTKFEVLVIDNHSTDNTEEMVLSFSDPRIRLLKIHNKGVIAASRNLGISKANGSLVAFLDSDDYWFPDKLKKASSLFHEGYDVVCNSEVWTTDEKTIKTKSYGPKLKATYESLLFRGNCVSTSAVVVKKRCLIDAGGFSEKRSFITVEDYDLWLKLSKDKCNYAFIQEPLGIYRIHYSNQSRNVLYQMKAELSVINSHFSTIQHWSIRLKIMKNYRVLRLYVSYGLRYIMFLFK
jgi:glycosyltransferase involved in cell wall biosynthesis